MANKTVGVDVKYSVDKNSLNELRKQLIDLRMEAEKAKIGGSLTKGLEEASKAASKLGDILDKSWNSKLNQLDLSKVNNEIKTTYGSVEKLKQAFSNSGAAGATAYNNFAMSVLNTNTQLKKTSETLDKMAITFKNTVRYGISSAVFNNLSNSIQRAYNYAKELDTSLNDIRIVTGKSADEMDKFAIRANRVAKELGRSTKDFTNAALIYYQQGLGNEEAQARAEVTMKAANVTGQSGREVSEQLTAVWNGYKVTADEAELYVDKLAAVAATTASDLEELSTGMSKVASAANLMGVDIDQLNAQLATIVSVTRQAPESVGTALKTIYARMGDIKAGLDDEVTLGKYTSQMAQYGINVLNANGQLRDMGEVIEEIGGKWTTMSREQQIALSQVMAGTRQYNNLLALFDGWDTYTNALETSAKAAGTLQKQQDIYMESTEAHLQKLSTEAERTYDILFDQNAVNGFADALTGVLNIFNNLLAGLGGGINDFVFFGSTIANIFNKQIGQSIERQIENIEIMRANVSKEEIQRQIIATHSARGENVTNASALDKETELMSKTLELQKYLTQEQLEQLNNSTAEIGILEQRIQNAEQYGKIANKYMSDYMNAEDATIDDFKEELKVQNELLDIEKNKYSVLKNNLTSYNERDRFYKLEEEQQKNITDSIKNATISLKDQEAVARIIAAIESEQELDENDIKIVLKEQRDIRNQQKQAVNELQFGLQGIQDKENGVLEGLKEQLSVEEKTVKAIHDQGDRQKMLSELTQGLSAVISLGTATVGIIKTIGDETLSSGEKIERVLSVALSNLPILLMNLSSLWKLLPNISVATKTLAITMGIEGVTAASSFSAALAGILTAIAPYVLAIGAVAAGIYTLVKAYNADKDAMEAASKNLQLITDDYNKAKEAAEGLKQTISNYNEEIQALDELKKGTEEYTKALEKANETAKKLIETYNLYDEYYYEDGLLKINEQALQKAQQNANNASNALERQMYLSRDQYNQKSLRANQTELRRSTGSAFNARGLWNDIFAPLTGGLTLLDNTINITDNEISSIVSTLRDVKNEDEEYYNKITQSNVALEKWINETYNGNERMQLLSNNIGEQVSSFKALVTQTDEMADAQKRYIKALNLSDLENRYGQHFESLLGNSGQAQQALDLLNRTSTEENLQNARSRRRNEDNFLRNYENRLGQNLYDNPELWKNEFGSNKNTLVTNVLKSIGLTEQQLINTLGYSEITSNQQLADAWAKVKNIDVSQATFKDNKYVNTAGETLIDVSSSDTRGTIRKNLTETVGMWFEDQDLEQFYEGLRNENVKLIDNLVLQAKTGGEKFGTDFSSTVLDYLSNPNSGFNLNSLIGQLSPSEIEAIQKMSAEDVSTMLGLTPDVLAEWGGKTTKEVGEEFQKAASEMPWDIDKAIETELANIQDKMPEGLTKKKMAEYEDSIRDYAKHLMEIAEVEEEVADGSDDLADTLKEDARSAILVSNSVIRMNKAINTLADNQEEWMDILKNSSIESEEYSKSLNNLRETMGDLFDLSEDTERYLDGEFFTQNAELIENAATGSEQAIEQLRNSAADKILLEIVLDNGFDETQAQAFQNVLNDIQAEIPNFKVGADFDFDGLDASEQDFIDKCQNLVDVANMTAEQASSFFESMGFEAEFETQEKPVVKKGRGTRTVTELKGSMEVPMPDGTSMTIPGGWETKTYPGEPYEYVDYVDAIAMTTDGTKPRIKSLTKKASGGMNNYSSKNTGGGSPGKSSSNKSGGGGGSSKAKQPSSMKQITDESDRYHDINIELGNISTKLQRLDNQKKKLFGKDLINTTNEEINLLNQQIEATNVKLGLMDEELEELKPKLLDKGFNLDASGVVTNYKDLIDAKIKSVKELIDAYNAMSAEEQEQAKQGIQDAQDDLKETIDIVNKYENLKYKEREDLINDRQKALDEITTRNIEKFNMEVEIRLDMAEAERDWNKFKREIIDGLDEEKQLARFIDARLDDFSSYYAGNGEGSIASLTKQVNSTLVELQKMDAGQANVYGNNRTQGLEDLKKWYTELMKNLEDVQALEKEIHESYIKMQDQAQKKFDEQVETFELIGDLIDHDMKVIQLVYGEDSYSALDKYYQKQENNNNQQLDFYRRQVEFWQKQKDAAKEGSEAWENAKEKWEDAVKNWKDLIIDSIEDLQDRYLNTINNIFDKLNDNITNGLGLEYVNEQWTLINKNAEQYLDSINALYEAQALENKYLDAIDKTDSVGAQRQLKELMDAELKDLRERDKLTQYDVERANKKYEIALKQIALQEAQQNKTKMRLRRDSQGNYRYEYTSDGNQIDQMQDEINNMYNSLYNFDKARYQENLGQIYDAWSEFQEKMAEAAQINDPQERAERELLLQEQYGELINGLVEQNSQVRINLQESAFEDLSRLYDEDSKAYQDMVNMETDALMNQLVPQWESGVQQMADNFAGSEGFLGVCKQAFEELHNATNDYENKLDELEDVAGEDFRQIYNGIDETDEITRDLLDDNKQLIDSYKDELGAIGDVITKLDALKTKYNEVAEAAKKAVQEGYEYQSKSNKQAADAAKAGISGTSPENSNRPSEGSTSDSNSDTKSGLAGVGDGNLIVGESATYTGKYYYDSFGTAPVGSRYSGVANGVVVDRITNNPYGIHIHSADGKFKDLGWIKKSQLSGYDTGGYTGAWGNDGRLALLHQKELVLNAKDTENMLNAVTIMRDITSVLGTSVLNRLAGIAAAGTNGTANNGLLDQNVNIQATFPNVTNSHEIEDALNNLVNMAAIRANRKGS